MKKTNICFAFALLLITYSCSKSGSGSSTTTPSITVKGVVYNNPTVTKDTTFSTAQYRRLIAKTTASNPSVEIKFTPLVPTASGSMNLKNGVSVLTTYNGKIYEGGTGTLTYDVTGGKITNINMATIWQYYSSGATNDSLQVSISGISEP